MKKVLRYGTAILVTSVLAACSSAPEIDPDDVPEWVLNPSVENGIAAATCVVWSGNLSIDKAQATSLSRTALAQQIETQVRALDKTYLDKVEVGSGTQAGSTFTQASKQLAEQTLVGSRVSRTEFAEFDGKKHLCVMTALGEPETKGLYEELLEQSGRTVSPSQKEVLYQEFKAQKAMEELDAEVEKFRKDRG
jgi:hypothetical protein